MRRISTSLFTCLATALLLAAHPESAQAATLRLVDVSNTAFDATGTATDTQVRVGDTFIMELRVDASETSVNGLQVHLDFDQTKLRILETSDAADSFPPASRADTASDEDHTTFGDVLMNASDGDTIFYAALTNADSARVDTVVARFTFEALSATLPNTTVIGFRFSPETSAVVAAGPAGTDVCTGVDSGIISIRLAAETHLVVTAFSPGYTGASEFEWVAIYNPSDDTVTLTNYYLSDDTRYYNIVTGAHNCYSGDFVGRFPAGAQIGIGETIVVALKSSTFHAALPGVKVDYELIEQDGAGDGVPDMTVVDVTGTPILVTASATAGEPVILFYWDQASDLVEDVDIVVYGGDAAAVPNKSGVSIDGPDAGAVATAFAADAATLQRISGLQTAGNVARRTFIADTEGNEVRTGGNGILGHDETSDDTGWVVSTDTIPWHEALIAWKRGDYVVGAAEASETGVEVMSFRLKGARGRADTLTALTLLTLGTADTANVDTVYLYADADGDSIVTGVDTLVATLAAADTNRWTLSAASVYIPASGRDFLLAFTVAATVQNGETFQARVPAYTLLSQVSDSASFDSITNWGTVTLSAGVLKVTKAANGPTTTMNAGDGMVLVLAVNVRGVGADTLTNLALDNLGVLDDTDVDVEFWRDNNFDLAWDIGDRLVGTLGWDTPAGRWRLDGISETLPVAGDTFLFVINLDLAAGVEGETFQAQIPTMSWDGVTAETGPALALQSDSLQTLVNPPGIANHVVIAAVYPDAALNDLNGEWILLYNPTAAPVPIDAWTIRTAGAVDATLPIGAAIPAQGHYLVADASYNANKDNPAWPNADYTENMTFNNGDYGKTLVDSTGATIDRVGYGAAGADQEGTSIVNPSTNAIFVRKAHALSDTRSVRNGERDELGGGAYDSYDNATDFVVLTTDSTSWTLADSTAAAETAGRHTTVVKIQSQIADATALNGDAVVLARLFVQGDTSNADTLNVLRVEATNPLEDTNIDTMALWLDYDSNGAIGAADSFVAYLAPVAGTDAWETSGITFAFGGLAGETFLVVADVAETVTDGETFQARVAIRTVKAAGPDSGPTAVQTSTGTITFRNLDPLSIVRSAVLSSDTAAAGETGLTALAFHAYGDQGPGGDSMTSFVVANVGTAGNADVALLSLYYDDGDSRWDSADTFAAALAWDAVDARWETAALVRLGSGADFVVRLDLAAAAADGRTFQARVPAVSCSAAIKDTGPAANVTETAIITVDTNLNVRLVLSEVNVDGAPDYVEIYVLDDGNGGAGANVAGWAVWDLEAVGERKILGDTNNSGTVDTPIIVRTGDTLVVWDVAGTDEDADTNGDRVLNHYDAGFTINSTDGDQIALYDASGSIRDAVAFTNGGDTALELDEIADVGTLLAANAWTGYAVQHSLVVPPTLGSLTAGTLSMQRATGMVDRDSYLDWGFGVPTPGAAPSVEAPLTAPAAVAGFVFTDAPNDFGGSLRATWTADVSVSDFKEFRIYFDSKPIGDLVKGDTIAFATSTDSSLSSYTFSGLVDGDSFWAAVTRVDSWGLELRLGNAAGGPAVSAVNITETPALLITEVNAQGTAANADTDYIEIYVADDGNPTGGLSLFGWTIDWQSGGPRVLGDVTVQAGDHLVLEFEAAGDTADTDAGADGVAYVYENEDGLTGALSFVRILDPRNRLVHFLFLAEGDNALAETSTEALAVRQAIDSGAWKGDSVEYAAVNPPNGASWSAGQVIALAFTDSRVVMGRDSWSVTTVRSKGAANVGIESPSAPPDTRDVIVFRDAPNDLGGALQILWDTDVAQADFFRYRVYLSTAPIDPRLDTLTRTPYATVTDSSVGTTLLSGLTTGQNYWALVTMVDTWGHERRAAVTDTGPVQPLNNITETPVLLITEVYPQATGGSDTDYLEIQVVEDGNPSGGIDLSNWKIDWATGGPRTLSGLLVEKGDRILVEFSRASDTADVDTGGDGLVSIYENDDGLVGTDAYARILDPNNRLVHFLFFSDRNGTFDTTGTVAQAVRQAIDSGAWAGDSVENAGVNPTGATWTTNKDSVIALAYTDSRVVMGRDSWSVTTVRTPGASNVGIESPATVPDTRDVLTFRDMPNDQGGSIEILWDTDVAQPDFLRYAVYLSTQPIDPRIDTALDFTPYATVTDSSVGTAALTGLVNGESYWALVTMVDTWGHERRASVSDTGPVAPDDDIVGTPDLRISEVRFIAGSTDAIEIYVVNDANPAGNLNLAGYKIAQDDTTSPEYVFGSATVGDGDYVVLYSAAGTSESDSGGDGAVVLYTGGATPFALPSTTDEGLFLIEAGGETITDFVFWSNRDQTMTASERPDLQRAIDSGAWTGGVFQGNGRTPEGRTTFIDSSSITRSATCRDSNTRYDWAIDSTPTLGGPCDIGEDPFVPPPVVANVDVRDFPSDFGGQLLVTWDSSPVSDFSHYHVYVETTPITDLRATDSAPEDTIAPASDTDYTVTTCNGRALVDGDSYWVAITAVDQYGNETLVVAADSAAPVANVSGERLLITEVSFRDAAVTGTVGSDWVEIYCDTDGTGGQGLNLSGWSLSVRGGTKTLGSTTLRRGEFLLVREAVGTDEADSAAGNGDTVVDAYGLPGLTQTDDHVFLLRSDGDTADFVIWVDANGFSIQGETDAIVAAVASGDWDDSDLPAGAGPEDAVSSVGVADDASIVRIGTSVDNDSRLDWAVDTGPTPGETNSANARWRVFGTVDMETRAVDSGVVIQVGNGTDTYTSTSDAAGSYVVRVPNGSYTLVADTAHYLRKAVTGISINDASEQQNAGTLKAGDANGDERIDIFDASLTKWAIDAATGDPAADHVDAVGTVNAADMDAVRTNFGLKGD